MVLLSACATQPGAEVRTEPGPDTTTTTAAREAATWPIRVREHVDLWLHGFALLQRDTARVPYFERGYAARYNALKTSANVLTQIETNRDRLEPRLVSTPAMVNAQFLALYFGSWEDMTRSIDLTLQVEGDVRRIAEPALQRAVAVVHAYFPTAADREWLRIYMMSLRDERDRFWRQWWLQEQQQRQTALARLDTLWHDQYRPRLQRFLGNTRQHTGDFLVALPLNGEGRTLGSGSGIRINIVAVGFPPTPDRAEEAIYVFAHEIISQLAQTVLEDNLSPAERRAGLDQQLSSNMLVRGGAALLQRAVPELADGYARYYLGAANLPVPAANVQAALASAFPLPQAVSEALVRQIDIVLAGI
ncbi:MAG TPA: hypothetical protein VMM18_16700 [Gemmatimonadaceae bacterium]|nr:hypothetical protein [Gemmatimonadaceae bacterium]